MRSRPIRAVAKLIPRCLRDSLATLFPRLFLPAWVRDSWRRPDRADWPPAEGAAEPGLARYEYSLFSQNGEDGVLRHLLSELGFRSRAFLEFGFGVTESNALRLALKEDFAGVFIDGSEHAVRALNSAAGLFGLEGVRAIRQWLTLENLAETIREGGLPPEIDLLSIDVDGNDYWFWREIERPSARLVVIEYNASLGPELSLTVPYDPAFERHAKHESGFYHGASLAALYRLGREKGYALVGCESRGVNAFFVREDCLTAGVQELSPRDAYCPDKGRLEAGFSAEGQLRMIEDMPYVAVE